MGSLMDLVAGDAREILLVIGLDDWAALCDRARFPAYVSLGGGMTPQWLDLFAEAAREVTGRVHPEPFTEACCRLEERTAGATDRTVETIDGHWIDAVATLPDRSVDAIAARWIDLIECEECDIDPDEKPMLRELAGSLVNFCRRAQGARDILFAWSL